MTPPFLWPWKKLTLSFWGFLSTLVSLIKVGGGILSIINKCRVWNRVCKCGLEARGSPSPSLNFGDGVGTGTDLALHFGDFWGQFHKENFGDKWGLSPFVPKIQGQGWGQEFQRFWGQVGDKGWVNIWGKFRGFLTNPRRFNCSESYSFYLDFVFLSQYCILEQVPKS